MKYLLVLFSLLALMQGCQKESAKEKAEDFSALERELTDTSIFFDAVIDGKREFHISMKNGYFHYWGGGAPMDINSSGTYEVGIESNGGINSLIFFRGALRLENNDTTFLLKNKRRMSGFDRGSYEYTADPNTISGVILHWKDKTGKLWGTNMGLASQAGSSFVITDIYKAPADPLTNIVHGMLVTGVFNCRLYDASGNFIQVSNGRMRMSVWPL